MRLLLDTHIAVWAADERNLLSSGERTHLEARDAELAFSAVSLWELRLKWESRHGSGERKGPLAPERMLRFIQGMGWLLLPLIPAEATARLDAPLPHNDRFDELLLIQAQQNGMRLLTRDARLAAHPLAITG